MIQGSELRTTNLVYDSTGKPMIVGICSNDPNTMQPIPLTSEILEKCGFEKEGSEAGEDGSMQFGDIHGKNLGFLLVPKKGKYMSKGSIGLWLSNNYGARQIKIDIKQVKYLHQLQNLYFALTGTELEIKL